MSTLYSWKTKTKDLGFRQSIDCPKCNRAGTLQGFKSFRQLSVNFIPFCRYKKTWYLKTTCCGHTYELSKEFGKRIEKKEVNQVSIEELLKGNL